MQWPFPRAAYIDHDQQLRRLADQLVSEALIAIDTESNSLYAYRERVCLIQLSTREHDYIIDPLRIGDMSPLGELLANPAIQKVFHAAEYDLICLKRDYGFTLVNLFDTMIVARICGIKAVGLDRLLKHYLDVQADKSHQRDDWGQRPLTEEGLLYAQMDTHYLPALRDQQLAEIERLGLMDEVAETMTEACLVMPGDNRFDPDGYWRIGIPADLNRRQMAILREIYLLREHLAEERDVPPFKIFNDRVMVSLAERAPMSFGALEDIKGLGSTPTKRYGGLLLNAIERGKQAATPRPPARPPDIEQAVAERFSALRDWRRMRAEQRGVDSDVIISKNTLWDVAYRSPASLDDLRDIRGLGPWRLATYGEEILSVVRRLVEQP